MRKPNMPPWFDVSGARFRRHASRRGLSASQQDHLASPKFFFPALQIAVRERPGSVLLRSWSSKRLNRLLAMATHQWGVTEPSGSLALSLRRAVMLRSTRFPKGGQPWSPRRASCSRRLRQPSPVRTCFHFSSLSGRIRNRAAVLGPVSLPSKFLDFVFLFHSS